MNQNENPNEGQEAPPAPPAQAQAPAVQPGRQRLFVINENLLRATIDHILRSTSPYKTVADSNQLLEDLKQLPEVHQAPPPEVQKPKAAAPKARKGRRPKASGSRGGNGAG